MWSFKKMVRKNRKIQFEYIKNNLSQVKSFSIVVFLLI